MALEQMTRQLEFIDRLLIKLITRRLAVLQRIHEHRDALNIPLFQKEEESRLKDRITRLAHQFSVNPGLVEVVFKQIQDESYRAYLSYSRAQKQDEARKTIAIIGGSGGMGRFFARIFMERGHDVLIATESTELTPVEAARAADLVIVSVPMAITVDVIQQVAPVMRDGACIMDVTSLKTAPLRAMLEHAPPGVEVIGTHPMFGPTVSSLLRQVVVMCPGRGEVWLPWLQAFLESQGALLKMATPAQHDKMMAVIQVLRHFSTIAMGKCLELLEVDLQESLEFTSPIYRLELSMIGRLFAQNPGLYADIEMQNPLSARVVAVFLRAASMMAAVVAGGDREAFIEQFRKTAEYFGDFRNQAMEESNYLITKLVDRLSS